MGLRLVITLVIGFAIIITACSKKAAKGIESPKLPKVSNTVLSKSGIRDTIMIDTIEVFQKESRVVNAQKKDPAVKEIPTEELISGPYLVASLTKSPCYGKCPVFEARIYSDGKVEFYGRRNVALLGYHIGYISQGSMNLLLKKAQEIDFFNLDQTYPFNDKKILDLPNTITYLKDGELEKNIIDNHSSPQALRNFESYFENLINALSFQKADNPFSE